MTNRVIHDAILEHVVETIKNTYNNQGVDAARQMYVEIKNILDSHHDTLNLAKLNRHLGEYYRNIIIINGGKRKTRRKKRKQSRRK